MVTLASFRASGIPRTLSAAFLVIFLSTPLGYAQEQVERSFAVALIRDVLTAVNHGNWTGNYTVVQDYAASGFSAANDPTRLAALFNNIRKAGLDMLPVLVTEPTILRAQTTRRTDQMRLTGYFPTKPQHFSFDLVFVREDQRWLLLDISIGAFDPIEEPASSLSSDAGESD